MELTQVEPAIKPDTLTVHDILASLALTAVGLLLTPVVGFFVLLVD
ncbi:MAG: hypothetical protein HXX15_13220 [Rhodopseudomonas sp.]|nr:hypothetical protein [Rhodopseudomonas sp.]NVN87035.1 hypothetical protein [Rhodopseudomonas sp.]